MLGALYLSSMIYEYKLSATGETTDRSTLSSNHRPPFLFLYNNKHLVFEH